MLGGDTNAKQNNDRPPQTAHQPLQDISPFNT